MSLIVKVSIRMFPYAGRDDHFHTDGGRRLETSKGRNRGKGTY
jgi:hypothetical protein